MKIIKGIPIFLSADNNYAPFVATTIASICDNTDSFCEFYILDGGITQENQEKIGELKKIFKNFSIEFIPINTKKEFSSIEYKNLNYISISTYNRFLIPKIKPEITKAIYLDVDIIVQGNIRELYDIDLDNYQIGATWESWIEDVFCKERNSRLMLAGNNKYFNAGVLLIDCKKWQNENLLEKVFNIEEQYRENLRSADQDILNIIYKNNNYKILDYKFNCPNKYFPDEKNMIIQHYMSHVKPWQVNPSIPPDKNFYATINTNIFWKYAKITPFYDIIKEKIIYNTKSDMNKFRVAELLRKTGKK